MSNQGARRRAGATSAPVSLACLVGVSPCCLRLLQPAPGDRPRPRRRSPGGHAPSAGSRRPASADVWSVRADTARPTWRPPCSGWPAGSGRSDLQVWVNGSSPSAVVMGYARAAADIGLADRGVAARRGGLPVPRMARPDRPALADRSRQRDRCRRPARAVAGRRRGQVLVTCHPSADLSEIAAAAPRSAGSVSSARGRRSAT